MRELAEQQKNQRAIEIKNEILKQTHDKNLAEPLSHITKQLEKLDESTKKIGDVINEKDSENENQQKIDSSCWNCNR